MTSSSARKMKKRKPRVETRRPKADTPFAITCACGTANRGVRKASSQSVTCSNCSRQLFVLGISPWPVVDEDTGAVASAGGTQEAKPKKERVWFSPLLAALCCLLLIGVGLYVGWPYLFPEQNDARVAELRAAYSRADEQLNNGDIEAAQTTLRHASATMRNPLAGFSSAEAATIAELRAQVDLVTTLSPIFLEEMLELAQRLPAQEWNDRFGKEFKGKTVVVRAFPNLRRSLPDYYWYALQIGSVPGHVWVENFPIHELLDLDGSVTIAGRLDSIRLEIDQIEPTNCWMIRFDAKSSVALTHPALRKFVNLDRAGSIEASGMLSQEQLALVETVLPVADVKNLQNKTNRRAWQAVHDKSIEQWRFDEGPIRALNFERGKDQSLKLRQVLKR